MNADTNKTGSVATEVATADMGRRGSDRPTDEVICPACQKAVARETLVAGVCAKCKSGFRTIHARVVEEHRSPGGPQSNIERRTSNEDGQRGPAGTAHFGENSELVATTEDSFEGFIQKYCQDFAVNEETALLQGEAWAEHFGKDGGEHRTSNIEHRTSNEVGSVDLRSTATGTEVMRLFKRGLRMVFCSRDFREGMFKLACMFLALNWFDELDGIESSKELADKWQVTKANANKYVNQFRDVLPPGMKVMPAQGGQRNENARVTFTLKREEQERKKGKTSYTN